ncbi:hypothetical protein JW872_00650 [Candidatus Babeliales bacterium]|nr:hypothetical protein [Candidatus Babeliales bacterium]
MKIKTLMIIMVCAGVAGMVYYGLMQQWIIVRLPQKTATFRNDAQIAIKKNKVSLWYYKKNGWHSETTTIIWPENIQRSLKHLLDTWFTFMDEEGLMKKKASVQSVVISHTQQEAYISLDRSPFDDQASVHTKWIWIETLLKTIRENGFTFTSIRLLVHHQPLKDYHLDFSKPWPLSGFLQEQTMTS